MCVCVCVGGCVGVRGWVWVCVCGCVWVCVGGCTQVCGLNLEPVPSYSSKKQVPAKVCVCMRVCVCVGVHRFLVPAAVFLGFGV